MDIRSEDYEKTILAFDYGDARIGLAIKPAEQASAEPLITLKNDASLWSEIDGLLALHQPDLVVIGRPRNLEGDSTTQTIKAEQFAVKLSGSYNNKVELQDEALTTEHAQERIPKNLSPKSRRGVIDQYAACIILEHYLQETQK